MSEAAHDDVRELPDSGLRSALEFAVGIAAAGQKLRPALGFPAALKPYLKFSRLDRPALRAVRKAVVGDADFRQRIGSVATNELVDPIGVAWLQRPDGWERTVIELHEAAGAAAEEASIEAALRRADKRREAAEQVAARAQAELVAHHERVAREQLRRERAEQQAASAAHEIAGLRSELTGLRREVERLRTALGAEQQRAQALEVASAEVEQRLAASERLRDELLAKRAAEPADAGNAAVSDANVAASRALQQAAAATRDLAEALAGAGAALVNEVTPLVPRSSGRHPSGRHRAERRTAIAIPGGVYGDSVAATEHLLRTAGAAVVVDGYNVAKLGWPQLDLIDQRERCIDLLEDVARRYGSDIRVVFDGADVVGASAGRRLIRVQFSPAGVLADDVIRDDVRALPARTPVVVVTNDQAIVNDVRGMGANVVASDSLLTVARRTATR